MNCGNCVFWEDHLNKNSMQGTCVKIAFECYPREDWLEDSALIRVGDVSRLLYGVEPVSSAHLVTSSDFGCTLFQQRL